jgi:site-specific recombinase XerD
LSKFFGWCTACGQSKSNPVDNVKGIAIVDSGPKSLDSTSLRRLLREVHVHSNAKDIAVLELLCGTGIRVGELVQIRLSDLEVSERKGSIHIRYGKGQSAREIPLNVDVRKALQNWLNVRPASQSQFLITSQRGGGMTPSGIWRIVKKYAALAGMPELSVHQLRHTVLTRLVREFGIDLVTVAKISGHRNLKTLMRYCAPNQEDLAEAVEKLALAGE